MKRFGLIPHITSATLFLAMAATDLQAQDGMMSVVGKAPAIKPVKSAPPATDLAKRFDLDGDGLLDDAERAAVKSALMKEPALAENSVSGGAMNAGERERGRAKMIEFFDKNGDGTLDADERAAAQKFASERGLGSGPELRAEIIRRFDKNANGEIDGDERAAVQEFMRGRMAKAPAPAAKRAVDANAELEKVVRTAVEKNAAQLKRFDADANGKLDDTEWAAAREQVKRLGGNQEAKATSAVAPKTEQEKRRLESVATEAAKRRKDREKPKPEAK